MLSNFYNFPFKNFSSLSLQKEAISSVILVKWDLKNECIEKLFDHGISNDGHAQPEFREEPQHCQQNLSYLSPRVQFSKRTPKSHFDGSRFETSNHQDSSHDENSRNRNSKSVKME